MSFLFFALAVCEKDKADVVFLLDRSSSITQDDHKVMLNFTSQLVKSFKVGQDLVHIGVAQFSDSPHHEFYLNELYKMEDAIAHINSMDYTGGNTNIGNALVFIKEYFTASRGSRRSAGVSQNLVLITDGDDDDLEDILEDAADSLRDMGIAIFAIGVGDVHLLQLFQITKDPKRLFNVQTFDTLVNIKQQVINIICQTPYVPDKHSELISAILPYFSTFLPFP